MAFKVHTLAILLAGASALAQAQPVMQDAILTDPAGRTLYVFDKDETNISHCSGPCLQAWPAYTADSPAGATPSSKATRIEQGGIKQWAWNGKPLYYFVGDAKPGDRAGDGSGGVWHIVKPTSSGKADQTAAASPTSY